MRRSPLIKKTNWISHWQTPHLAAIQQVRGLRPLWLSIKSMRTLSPETKQLITLRELLKQRPKVDERKQSIRLEISSHYCPRIRLSELARISMQPLASLNCAILLVRRGKYFWTDLACLLNENYRDWKLVMQSRNPIPIVDSNLCRLLTTNQNQI